MCLKIEEKLFGQGTASKYSAGTATSTWRADQPVPAKTEEDRLHV
jgi:hypothetical protein